jgi:hypothetical protein
MRSRICFRILTALFLLLTGTSCISAYHQIIGSTDEQFERIFITDFNTAWQSILDALKNNRLDITNREGGYLQTKWVENTAEKNFTESFGNADSYLKAQSRFRIIVSKGFYNGRNSIKVAVQKEQLVQRDVLEGWRPVETDTIDEKSLLYRIGRLIALKMKITKMNEEKTAKELKEAEQANTSIPSSEPSSSPSSSPSNNAPATQ